jgi:hypothetical protein
MCSPVTWDDSQSRCNEIERAVGHAIYDLPRRDQSGEADAEKKLGTLHATATDRGSDVRDDEATRRCRRRQSPDTQEPGPVGV